MNTSMPPSPPPPGWYPDPQGVNRWWDGSQWTHHVSTPGQSGLQDQRALAICGHALGPFTWVFGPLVIYLLATPEQKFARDQAMEALNYQVLWTIPMALCILLMLVLIGFVLIIPLFLLEVAGTVMACIGASHGHWYRYPVNWRMFRP